MNIMADKLFLYGGVSCLKGTPKVRFTNDPNRTKVLEKDGQTNVHFIGLPEPMTKEQVVEFIAAHEDFQYDLAIDAVADMQHPKVMKPVARAVKASIDQGTYLYAGIACKNGEYRTRFAQDEMRSKILYNDGQTDIRLVKLPQAMSKYEACCYIINDPMFDDEIGQTTLDAFISDNRPKVTTAQVKTLDQELEDELAGVKFDDPFGDDPVNDFDEVDELEELAELNFD